MASRDKALTPDQFRAMMAGGDDRTKAHNKLVNLVITYLSSIGISAWRCDTGRNVVHTGTGWARGTWYGTKGAADVTGILRSSGRRLEIEVKTGSGALSDAQRTFLELIRENGGIGIEARSVADVADDPDIVTWRKATKEESP